MKIICLKGQRSNRTPLSYPEYQKLFQSKFKYTRKPEDADLLVYSCFMDIRDDVEELKRIYSARPNIQLVILSEEPLWDSLWSDNCFSKKGRIQIGDREYPYTFLNHWTTTIYDFENIPYFLTTGDDYFARYAFLFSRNRAYKASELKSLWDNVPTRIAFFAEFKDDAHFDAYFPEYDAWGLSRYRTLIAKEMKNDKVLRVGKGWGDTKARQLLPDWHLDKLAGLDRQSYMVSGIENTHQWNYVSEKIFDAFAVMAIPLYFANSYHGVFRFASEESFLNLYGLTVDQAVNRICSFKLTKEFMDAYRAVQSTLAEIFSQPMLLVNERMRVVSEVVSELEAI